MEEKKKSNAARQTGGEWLVRNERDERFGPVSLEVLQEWARDGRLAPGNEVSQDGGGNWQAVTALEALEMVWLAEVAPGSFYGPIHYAALQELIRDGSIAAGSRLFVRRSGEQTEEQKPGMEQEAEKRSTAVVSEAAAGSVASAAVEGRNYDAELRRIEQSVAQLGEVLEASLAGMGGQLVALQRQGAELREAVQALEDGARSADGVEQVVAEMAGLRQVVAESLEVSATALAGVQRMEVAAGEHELAVQGEVSRVAAEVAALRGEVGQSNESVALQLDGIVEAQRRQSVATQTESEALSDVREQVEELRREAGQERESLAGQVSGIAELVAKLESQGVAVLQQLTSVAGDVGLGVARLDGVEQVAADIAELKSRVAEVSGSVAEVSGSVAEVSGSVDAVCGRLAEIAGRESGVVGDAVGHKPIFFETDEVEVVEAEAVAEPEREPETVNGAGSVRDKASGSTKVGSSESGGVKGGAANGNGQGGWAKGAQGASLMELEMQARRELERLSASGKNPFQRKR